LFTLHYDEIKFSVNNFFFNLESCVINLWSNKLSTIVFSDLEGTMATAMDDSSRGTSRTSGMFHNINYHLFQ